MGLIGDALGQVDMSAPVILSLPRPLHGSGERVERFTFPALSDAQADDKAAAPTVAWPRCDETETMVACATTADRLLRRLSPRTPVLLGMTSPCDGVGVTSLLVGMAPELAARGWGDVLVVDAHLRKADLTQRLNLPDGELSERPMTVHRTNVSRLFVLPTSVQMELPNGRLDRDWIGPLRRDWSLVLLDLPSLEHRDTASIAHDLDGILLTIRLGQTSKRAVAESARVIRGAGGRLVGCIAIG